MLKNYFITRRQHNIDAREDIIILDNLDLYHEYMRNNEDIGLDTENTRLHPMEAIPLLIQFGFREGVSFVIDRTSVKEDFLSPYKRKKFIGVNLQYDYKIIKWHYGVELRNLEDIMITEQIIGRGSGRGNSLEAIHERRLNKPLPEDKHTREDFIKMGENSIFNTKHILYGGYDPYCPLLIREVHRPIVEQYNLTKRVYDIAQPLIPILGDMSLEGLHVDETRWRQILSENKENKFKYELELDREIINFSKNEVKLRGGIWTNPRRKQELTQVGLFGENTEVVNPNIKNVSYSSSKQLVKLFTILNEPIPQKVDKEVELQWGEDKKFKNSFAEEALEQYKIQYPESRMKPFIDKLLKFKEVEKAINSFGEIFLKEFVKTAKSKSAKVKKGYYNPITKKVHTVYKQEFTKNGRLSSGDVKIGFYNSQQMIKEPKYRNSFCLTPEEIAEGWYMSTYDLSAAELIILANNSKDRVLIDILSQGKDLHSFLATAGYNKIVQYILNNMPPDRQYDELRYLFYPNRLQNDLHKVIPVEGGEPIIVPYTKAELEVIADQRVQEILSLRGFKVDKKKHIDIREPSKNVHYGINYGAAASKVAETLNIAPYYAQLYLDGIEEAIPDAMAYLKRIAKFGVKHGYIIFNERTNSRHWFKSWLQAYQWGRELSKKEKSAIERFCKNSVMSGTQADMIKEGMVVIQKHVEDNNIEFKWLLQVHDELVFKHKSFEFGAKAGDLLVDTCNLYLQNIKMKVSGHTGTYWYKG